MRLRVRSRRQYGRWSSIAEALAPERGEQAPPMALGRAVARAAGQADDALRVLLHLLERRVRRCALARVRAGVRMRRGQQPAEVGVARAVGREQREVRSVIQGHLRAGDRLHAEALARVRELHRPVQPVVVGQRDGLVAVHRRRGGHLLRRGRAVQERVRRVRVQLGVGHRGVSSGLM